MKNTALSRVLFHISKTWRYHFKLQIATFVVLIACFTVVAGVLTMSTNLNRVLTLWGESMQVSVYLKEDANQENLATVEKYLQENKEVEKAKFVTKAEALQLFQEQMASYAPDILGDKDLIKFIPTSFQFGISKSVAVQDQLSVMQNLATSLKVMPGVEDVSYGQDWVKSYSSITNTLTWAGAFFVVIILFAAAFVMANSIHTSIHQRRQEIEVMELVGATARYIRLPFIWEGAILGAVTSSIALLFCFGVFAATKDYLQGQIAFLQLAGHIQYLNANLILSVVLFGTVIGSCASWLCVRGINSGWASVQAQRAE